MNTTPLPRGNPFILARSSCRHAAQVARDVFIEADALQHFAASIDTATLRDLPHGSMGENCDTVAGDFFQAEDAVNFALLFCLLQFGHGFRAALHEHCGRGASQTITRGVRALHADGKLDAARLRRLTLVEIIQAFGLPSNVSLAPFAQQLEAVIHQAGCILENLGCEDFATFCRWVSSKPEAVRTPAATLVEQLARHFPAFNDQGVLADGTPGLTHQKRNRWAEGVGVEWRWDGRASGCRLPRACWKR